MSRTLNATAMSVIVLLALLLLTSVGAGAHGGGPVRAIWDDASGFYMVIESNETPAAGLFGGVVHVTMMPTAHANATERLRGLEITVTGVGPEGRTAGPIRAKQILSGPYEADLMVSRPGVWRIWIEVGEGERVQQFQFPLEVVARSVWTDLGIVGGLMLIPILGISSMVRRTRRRKDAAQSNG